MQRENTDCQVVPAIRRAIAAAHGSASSTLPVTNNFKNEKLLLNPSLFPPHCFLEISSSARRHGSRRNAERFFARSARQHRSGEPLVTLGAPVPCLGSPLFPRQPSRMIGERCSVDPRDHRGRAVAAAFTTSFAALLALRLVMVAAAAPFTPQAAGVVGLILPLQRRASAIAYVFLGWSLAAAAGLPLMTAIASRSVTPGASC